MTEPNDTRESFPTDTPAVVTCGLPYANGDLHIGHFRTFIGGDVYARALERLGQETAFVCGSDMHGTPIAVTAEERGEDPETFALEWHRQYEEMFPQFNVAFDNYGHTHDETNTQLTREFVRTLADRGHVYEKDIKVAYDPAADQSLPDRYVEGTCPYCGERARGDECDEGCGRHLEPGEVEDPHSTITGNRAEYRDRTHKFFRVSDFQEYLSGFLDRLEGTANAQNQPREWIEGELRDWCITRDMDWGIDYPGDDEEDLVLYVWVDAPIEYVASSKQYTERVGTERFDWERAWQQDGEIVHVIGRDIIQHHTVFWPAMLRGVDYQEPRAVMASGFMTLDGKGFSTSRNRAVWAKEYLEEGFHPDLLRFYIATAGSFQDDVDFSWDRFKERVNNELVGTVGNFVYRTLLFAERNFGGVPEVSISDQTADRIEDAITAFEAGVVDYSIRDVGAATVDLARYGNEYIQQEEPWNLVDEDPDAAAQVIRDCVQLVKAIAVLFEPIAPGKSETLWTQLGEPGTVEDATVEAALKPPAGELGEPTELYDKISADRVETLNAKLDERVTGPDATESDEGLGADDESMTDLEPITDERISFEEFQELDLRVGEVVTADPIEESDDLVRLEVDIGLETRQVIAGIKQLHDVESLPGRKVVIVANLEQAELFGYQSDGMVLAAGEEADLLTTHGDADVGEKVR